MDTHAQLSIKWRFETDVPLLMSPLHTSSLSKFSAERHEHRKAPAQHRSHSPVKAEIPRRPPMPLPNKIRDSNLKYSQSNTNIEHEER